MFTGIIEEIGHVVRLSRGGEGAELLISAQRVVEDLSEGDSLCVSGACLTVTEVGGGRIRCDLSAETLRRTTLGDCKPGDGVNLERPLRLGSALGGHFVNGHVDCVGTITRVHRLGAGVEMDIALSADGLRYVVEKGCIAVDGVSLTPYDVTGEAFRVALIPETLARTALGSLRPKDRVNIETDIIGKYVERLMREAPSAPVRETIDRELLERAGFTD